MADQDTHPDMDMKAHNRTYEGVMALMKWGTIVSALLAAIVVWIIA